MTQAHQAMLDRFEASIGELHELTNEMILMKGLDMHIKAQAALLNTYLELNLPEYFKEKK